MLADTTPVFLLSPWKPVLITVTFIAWAWLLGTKLDKDARLFRLNPEKWNAVHITCAAVALGIMLGAGIFYISYPIGVVVLITPILLYWRIRNAAVPEGKQFKLGTDSIKSRMEQRKIAKAGRSVSMRFESSSGPIPIPGKEDPQLGIYLDAETYLAAAIDGRASRLEMQLSAKGCAAAMFVDGVGSKLDPLPTEDGAKLFAFVKSLAGTDPDDVRRRQVGSFEIEHADRHVLADLTASGGRSAQVLRLEFDRREGALRSVDTIGFMPKQSAELHRLRDEELRHGIVLIGGERQQGLTTTGYALIASHDAYLCNIRTLEHEVIANVEGVTHQPLADGVGDYATQLQTIVRRDPEVILATDLVDAEAAKIAVKPGLDGPLIFITMPAKSMNDMVSNWAGMIGDPRAAFSGLRAVIYQRLVRRLCENCRVGYKPSEDLARQGLPIEGVDILFQAGGQIQIKNKVQTCPVCRGTGYLGQVAVFETLFLDDEGRKHLVAGDLKAARSHARRNKHMTRLQEAAWFRVAEGQTSLKEFGRVAAAGKPRKPASAKAK